ncbi:MAG: hypothetical protein ACYTG0_30295 [Planctomycetota bacterium]|jgi:hypothetical protein
MDPLRLHIAAGRRYLVIELIAGTAILTDGRGVFRRPGGPGFVQFAAVDLVELLEWFEKKAPDSEVFTLTEISHLAGEKSSTLHAWVRAGVLTPSVRDRDGTRGRAMLFSRLDALEVAGKGLGQDVKRRGKG